MGSGLPFFGVLRQAVRDDRLLRHAGMGDSVAVERRAQPVAKALQRLLPRWPDVEPGSPARIRVSGREGQYRIHSPWLMEDQVAQTPTSAACALIIEMARSWLDAHMGMLCLHCAAFELNGRLIVLAGTNRSGKSTLAAALGAAGARIYCDDMMPLSPDGRGVALGIPPRLRLPLPASLAGSLAATAAERLISHDDRYGYVMPSNLAEHGASAPIGGIVLLHREDDTGPVFHSVDHSEAVTQLLLRNLHRDITAEETVTRLLAVAHSVPVISLRYARIDEAVKALLGLGKSWPDAAPLLAMEWGTEDRLALAAPSGPYVQSAGVWTQAVEGDIFAVSAESEEIFRLNPVASVLWDLFVEPTSADDATDLLADAFPSERRHTLEADVAALMAALLQRGLIRPA